MVCLNTLSVQQCEKINAYGNQPDVEQNSKNLECLSSFRLIETTEHISKM